jgi:hypothetical protein
VFESEYGRADSLPKQREIKNFCKDMEGVLFVRLNSVLDGDELAASRFESSFSRKARGRKGVPELSGWTHEHERDNLAVTGNLIQVPTHPSLHLVLMCAVTLFFQLSRRMR